MSFDITSKLDLLSQHAFLIPVALAVWIAALFLAKRIFFSRLAKAAKKTSSRFDDVLVEALNFPLTILILTSAVVLLRSLVTVEGMLARALHLFLLGSVVLAAVILGLRLVNGVVKHYQDSEKLQMLGKGIAGGLIKAAIILLGTLMFLQAAGIPITPILASLGIGTLAVALALQDTLGNLFAGIHITLDKPVRVGDFVQLESGEKGTVIEIGWRSTRVHTLPNNVVVVPNSKLTNSVLTNYHLPDASLAVLVQVGVHYNSDLARVEKVTCEVAKHTQQTVPGADKAFEPFIRYHTFADSSVNFTVILRAMEFVDQYLLQHEFIKALHARYTKENITIPFPTRTLDVPPDVLNQMSARPTR